MSDPHRARPRTDGLPVLTEWLLRSLRPVGQPLLRLYFDLHQHRQEFVPTHGPVILAANHTGVMDGPLLVGFAPRLTHALIKAEMYDGPIAPLLNLFDQIPVNRSLVDKRAVTLAVRALRDNQVVAIYPEGRRGRGDFATIKRGVAYLALVTGAPIVPVAVFGTRAPGKGENWLPPPGTRIDIVYGEPILVRSHPWPRRRDEVEALTRDLQKRLMDHASRSRSMVGAVSPGLPPDYEPPETGSITVGQSRPEGGHA